MSPYDEGRAAAAGGSAENPYAEGTYPFAEWSRGYGGSEDASQADAAFDEGKAAAAAGKPRESNPYEGDDEEEAEKHSRWLAGFDADEDPDQEGTPLGE